jgi:hypothetical protein
MTSDMLLFLRIGFLFTLMKELDLERDELPYSFPAFVRFGPGCNGPYNQVTSCSLSLDKGKHDTIAVGLEIGGASLTS